MQTETFSTLFKSGKKNNVLQWEIWVEDAETPEDNPCIHRKSGQIGGKFNTKKTFVKKGTNLGRANEKTKLEQAIFKANNFWKDKIEDNFVEDQDRILDPPKYLYPMLAKTYKKGVTKLNFDMGNGYCCQPKLNGIRAWQLRHLNDLTIQSRKLNEFPALSHIKDAVDFMGKYSPDGEVYIHGEIFQNLVSWTKKFDPVNTPKLQYWIYDLAIPNVPFIDRIKLLNDLIPDDHPILKKVPTYQITCHEDIHKIHDDCVRNGYEGNMTRFMDADYGFNLRPADLYKYKEFFDEEFPVVGYTYEEYHDVKSDTIWKVVMWTCKTAEGLTFDVRPKQTMLLRKAMYEIGQTMVGKSYTVRYQEKSVDNIPIFPVGIGFRDYE